MVTITDKFTLALGTDIGARRRRNSGVGILDFQAIVIETDSCDYVVPLPNCYENHDSHK